MSLSIVLPDEKFIGAAQRLVEESTERIWISTFKAEITSKPRGKKLSYFFDTIFEKAALGLDVRCLMNRPDKGKHVPISNEFAIRAMLRNKVEVRYLPHARCVHAKLLLVDSTAAIIGSHNLSVKSCQGNSECSLYLINKNCIADLNDYYENTWLTAIKI